MGRGCGGRIGMGGSGRGLGRGGGLMGMGLGFYLPGAWISWEWREKGND